MKLKMLYFVYKYVASCTDLVSAPDSTASESGQSTLHFVPGNLRPAYTAHKFQRLPLSFVSGTNHLIAVYWSSRNFCSVCRPKECVGRIENPVGLLQPCIVTTLLCIKFSDDYSANA